MIWLGDDPINGPANPQPCLGPSLMLGRAVGGDLAVKKSRVLLQPSTCIADKRPRSFRWRSRAGPDGAALAQASSDLPLHGPGLSRAPSLVGRTPMPFGLHGLHHRRLPVARERPARHAPPTVPAHDVAADVPWPWQPRARPGGPPFCFAGPGTEAGLHVLKLWRQQNHRRPLPRWLPMAKFRGSPALGALLAMQSQAYAAPAHLPVHV